MAGPQLGVRAWQCVGGRCCLAQRSRPPGEPCPHMPSKQHHPLISVSRQLYFQQHYLYPDQPPNPMRQWQSGV